MGEEWDLGLCAHSMRILSSSATMSSSTQPYLCTLSPNGMSEFYQTCTDTSLGRVKDLIRVL